MCTFIQFSYFCESYIPFVLKNYGLFLELLPVSLYFMNYKKYFQNHVVNYFIFWEYLCHRRWIYVVFTIYVVFWILHFFEWITQWYMLCIYFWMFVCWLCKLLIYYSKLLLISECPYTWHDINRWIISTFDPNHNWPAQGPLITWVTKFWNKRAWNPITAALYQFSTSKRVEASNLHLQCRLTDANFS